MSTGGAGVLDRNRDLMLDTVGFEPSAAFMAMVAPGVSSTGPR